MTFSGIYYLGYSNPKVAEEMKTSKWQYLSQPVLGSIVFAVQFLAISLIVFEYSRNTNFEPILIGYAVNYTGLLITGNNFIV